MGREVRRVPKDWQHPKKENGHYRPLYDSNYQSRLEDWQLNYQKWREGFVSDFRGGWEPKSEEYKWTPFSEYDGAMPEPENYMPEWKPEDATWLMMYETCSEGTPISPAFETPEELAHWLADNNASAFGSQTASYEAWLEVAKGGFAPSAVYSPQTGLISGVEAGFEFKQGEASK